jgi:uncharacterized membrane protein YhhN
VKGAAWIPVAIGVLALAALVFGEARRRVRLHAAAKVTLSAGYVALALLLGGGTPYARLVLAALLLSAAGDALLLSEAKRPFLAGLGVFLLAHVAYAAAFWPASSPMAWTALALAGAAALVLRWLWPRLGELRGPVIAYVAAVSAMLWIALSHPSHAVRVGAALFYLSDLAVARDRFVAPGSVNRLAGHPVYFVAQYLIASSVG